MRSAVQNMFDGIAGRYDFLNHFLSAGRDKAWRKSAVAGLPGPGFSRVLDLCGGTGDFWKAWADEETAHAGKIESLGVVADFSLPMLSEAGKKFSLSGGERQSPPPVLLRMDALHPACKDGRFDVVLCGYGMRNLDSLDSGIGQVKALLRPGGVFVTLEFFRPATVFTRFFYGVLAPVAIPLISVLFASRREAYVYLVKSVRAFCLVEEYADRLRNNGFAGVTVRPRDFGISHVVTAIKG